METLEVVAMIYKSVDYLDFIRDQMNRYCQSNLALVSTRVVANDPVPEIEDRMTSQDSVYHDDKPNDYYLNRVYRCWNYCVETSKSDMVVLVNSDMAFSPNWLDPLIEAYHARMLPVSRLVESGKLRPGRYCIEKDFGKSPKEFDESAWLSFAKKYREVETNVKGMFMPVLFDREEFVQSKGYPHGNVGAMSGDDYFFRLFESFSGRQHVTCFDSLVYHIQEGEKDS
jgi:hypothetical protein